MFQNTVLLLTTSMPLRQSAVHVAIRARKTAVMADKHSSADAAALIGKSDKSCCLCGGTEDGRLMLHCDQHSKGCCVWYHFDCLGLSQSEAEELGATDETFVCPNCNSAPTHPVLSTASIQYSKFNHCFSAMHRLFVGRDTG